MSGSDSATHEGTDRRSGRRGASIVLLLLGLGIGAEATTFEVAFVTDAIGPKALPLLVAVIFVVAGALQFFDREEAVEWPSSAVLTRMAGAVLVFVTYAWVLPWIGFFLSTTAVVWLLSWLYGGPGVRSGVAAALLSGVLWLLFVVALGLPLPIGELWMR